MAKPNYAVAMSQQDGCLVMLLNTHVVGSMTRIQSELFAKALLDWKEEDALVLPADQPEPPRLQLVRP